MDHRGSIDDYIKNSHLSGLEGLSTKRAGKQIEALSVIDIGVEFEPKERVTLPGQVDSRAGNVEVVGVSSGQLFA